uniref:Uncharacterized protein n=1 Tax=Timema monikensis TaxID=170555 RepID=A0A7R9HVL1_9NEOP|nr:unnamed protein product [Timema monikensis]
MLIKSIFYYLTALCAGADEVIQALICVVYVILSSKAVSHSVTNRTRPPLPSLMLHILSPLPFTPQKATSDHPNSESQTATHKQRIHPHNPPSTHKSIRATYWQSQSNTCFNRRPTRLDYFHSVTIGAQPRRESSNPRDKKETLPTERRTEHYKAHQRRTSIREPRTEVKQTLHAWHTTRHTNGVNPSENRGETDVPRTTHYKARQRRKSIRKPRRSTHHTLQGTSTTYIHPRTKVKQTFHTRHTTRHTDDEQRTEVEQANPRHQIMSKEQTFTTDESIYNARPSTSDINRQRNHIFDYAPRTNTDDSFTIIIETRRTYSWFNTLGRDNLVLFKTLILNVSPMQYLTTCFSSLLAYLLRATEPYDLIGFTITNKENNLDKPVGVSYRRCDQINSNARFGIADVVMIRVNHIKMIMGNGLTDVFTESITISSACNR